jgi:hypothetical protein
MVIPYVYLKVAPKQILVHQKCPEEYTEDNIGTAEYKEELTKRTVEFFKENPNATMSDWSMTKTQLWIDNNCTVALQRSKLLGKVSDLKMWEKVDYEIQNALYRITN